LALHRDFKDRTLISGISNVIVDIFEKAKEIMMKYDEEGRKIDFGQQVGMSLEGMSVDEIDKYISNLKVEITRAEIEKEKLQAHNATANALFK
jgi:uncharacterized small protein (DUF1192 family)